MLYRAGDLPAARERYYAALELDEEYVEARATLGCVLAETGRVGAGGGDVRRRAWRFTPTSPTCIFIWRTRSSGSIAATRPRRTSGRFLELAPESPWADAARDRLAGSRNRD